MEIDSCSKASAFNTPESLINKNFEFESSKTEVGMHFYKILQPSPFLLSPFLSTPCTEGLVVAAAQKHSPPSPLLSGSAAISDSPFFSLLPRPRSPFSEVFKPHRKTVNTNHRASIYSDLFYTCVAQQPCPPPHPAPQPFSPARSSQLSPLAPPLLLFPTWQTVSLNSGWQALTRLLYKCSCRKWHRVR